MGIVIKFCLLISILVAGPGYSAVLIEEGGQSVASEEQYDFVDTIGRNKRRVGLGISGAGVWGSAGIHLDLNFTPEYSLQSGVGLGEGFRTFAVQVKKYMSRDSFLPYLGIGFSRWYTTGRGMGEIETSNPGILASRFLSEKERATGKFSEVFVYPSLGLQYFQTTGEWAGSSVHAEINFLVDLEDFVLGTTGSLGYTRFF